MAFNEPMTSALILRYNIYVTRAKHKTRLYTTC